MVLVVVTAALLMVADCSDRHTAEVLVAGKEGVQEVAVVEGQGVDSAEGWAAAAAGGPAAG